MLLQNLTGTKLSHVPHRGDTPAIADLVAGQVQLAFLSISPLIPQVRSGAPRALAITSDERSAVIPDLPTLAESGLPGYNIGTWWGLMAPAKTPRPIIDRLAAAMRKATGTASVKERFIANGIEAKGNSPEEFAAMVKSEVVRYGELAKVANVKPNEAAVQ